MLLLLEVRFQNVQVYRFCRLHSERNSEFFVSLVVKHVINAIEFPNQRLFLIFLQLLAALERHEVNFSQLLHQLKIVA